MQLEDLWQPWPSVAESREEELKLDRDRYDYWQTFHDNNMYDYE